MLGTALAALAVCGDAPIVDGAGDSADVIVAGGGVAGLTAAAWLADRGLRVVVVEKSGRLGGRAVSWTDATTGDAVDIGPHVLLSDYRNFLALLERLGTVDQIHWQQQPLITLMDSGQRIDMRASSLPAPMHGLPNLPRALRRLSARDLLSNVRVAWRAMRWDEQRLLQLDGIDGKTFLQAMGVSARSLEWFWASACLTVLNVPLGLCSATSLLRVSRFLVSRSGYAFGFAKTGLSDLFAPGCVDLVAARGGRVVLGARVTRVIVEDGTARGVMLNDGRSLRSACVVLALEPRALADVAVTDDARWGEIAAFAGSAEPSPYISLYLWFDRKVTSHAFWARVHDPDDLCSDFYDVARFRAGVDANAPSLIACNAIHVDAEFQGDDETLIRRAHDEIVEFAPAAKGARIRHAVVNRIPMAIPAPRPGFETSRPASQTCVGRLWLAGDWTRTRLPCSMESAARSGAIAAERVLEALSQPASIAKAVPPPTGAVRWLQARDAR